MAKAQATRLKRNAVPSKFDFPTSSTSTSKKPRVASERRAQERARREVSLVLLIFYRNINSKCLGVWQSRGLSNVSQFHYDLYLYEKAYFRYVVPGKIKRESCFVFEKQPKTSFEKNCFSAWASTLNMGLINKVDMVCLSPVGYGV